jgi:hypothetical protein
LCAPRQRTATGIFDSLRNAGRACTISASRMRCSIRCNSGSSSTRKLLSLASPCGLRSAADGWPAMVGDSRSLRLTLVTVVSLAVLEIVLNTPDITTGTHFTVDRKLAVSADLKGSQFSRFRCEPESLPMVAEHTDAAAAVEDKQSRLRVCSPPTISSSRALLPRYPLLPVLRNFRGVDIRLDRLRGR